MNNLRFLPLVVISLLLVLLFFFYQKSQLEGDVQHSETVEMMLNLKKLDALLNQDILEIRYHSQLNLDAISRHEHQAGMIIKALVLQLDQASQPIRHAAEDVKTVFAEKMRRIEQFKAHNGILKNSLSYLPTAVESEKHSAAEAVAGRYDQLLAHLFRYVVEPGRALEQRIRQALDDLRPAGGELSYVAMHSEVVLREHHVVSQMMHELFELKSADLTEALFVRYDMEYRAAVAAAESNRIALIAFSVILLIYVLFLFRKQSLTARQLSRSLHELEFQKRAMDQHAIVSVTDADGSITYANERFREVSGFSADELIGSTHHLVDSGYHDDAFFRRMWKTIQSGKVWHGEILNKRKSGRRYWVDTTIVPFTDEDGQPFQYVAIRTDITALKRIEAKLKQEHSLMEGVLAGIPSILIGLDAHGVVSIWNRAAEQALDKRGVDVIGMPLSDVPIQWQADEVQKAIEQCSRQGMYTLDNFAYTRSDGSNGLLGITLMAMKGGDKKVAMLLLASDISERVRLQNRLQLSQKMEAIGELAAGIAHEVNTPLQYVGDNVRFFKTSFTDIARLFELYGALKNACEARGDQAELIEAVTLAEEEADLEFLLQEIPAAVAQSLEGVSRAARIVGAMKEFSHPGQKDMAPSDINRMLENTVMVTRNEWKYVANLHTDFDENLPPVVCMAELNQVFLNIIVNAVHAIGDRIAQSDAELGDISIATRMRDRQVEIEISDTGTGISEAVRHRIFDPFFTTKGVGKGTGQGLAISHAIVEQHGGVIELVSEVGKGSTFLIRIPINKECAD